MLLASVQALYELDDKNRLSFLAEQHDKIYAEVKNYINHHYSEDITLLELSKFAGYSPNYLNTLFRKHEHQSIHQYLLNFTK